MKTVTKTIPASSGRLYEISAGNRIPSKFNNMNATLGLDRVQMKGYNEKNRELLLDAGVILEAL